MTDDDKPRPSVTPAALDAAYRALLKTAHAGKRAWYTIPWQTRAMLAWMKTNSGGHLGAGQVARVWIWSDLHLNHAEVVSCFSRPSPYLVGARTEVVA